MKPETTISVPSDTGKPSALLCAICANPATCSGIYDGDESVRPACDTCCGHGNEGGWCNPIPTESDTGKPLCTRVECLAPCAGCFEDPDGGFLNCKRFDVARHLADNNEGDPVQVPRRRYQRLLATQPSETPDCKWCTAPAKPGLAYCSAECHVNDVRRARAASGEPVCPDPTADTEEHVRDCPSAAWLREQLHLVGEHAMKALEDESEWKRRAIDAEHDRDRALDRLREVNGTNASLQSRIHDL